MTDRASTSRRWFVATVLALTVVGGSVYWLAERTAPEPLGDYTVPRTLRYVVTVRNPSNRLIRDAEFWAQVPVAETPYQRVTTIDASDDYALLTDHDGNRRLSFRATVPPFGSKQVRVQVGLLMADAPAAPSDPNDPAYLAPTPKIQSNAPAIRELASALTQTQASATMDRVFDWVVSTLSYSGYVAEDRGALHALETKRGDCTEFSFLFTALGRAANVPVRPIAGFVTTRDAVVRGSDVHNWAEAYIDGHWRLFDPQNGVRRDQQSNYVAMRVLTPNGIGSTTHQLVGADSRLTVSLNP